MPAAETRGRVALFAGCYANYNEPHVGEDIVRVFEHNGIPVTIAARERCCGMPKLELGDLDAVSRAREVNVPNWPASWTTDGTSSLPCLPAC